MNDTKPYTYQRYKRTRFWAVQDEHGSLIAVTVYKKGARAVALRLTMEYGYTLTEAGRQALEEAERAARK